MDKNTVDSVYKIGEKYLIRTFTMILVGELKLVTQQELVLSSASWVADTGRFHKALRDGEFEEVEPFVNDCIVGRSALVDATIWNHELPKGPK